MLFAGISTQAQVDTRTKVRVELQLSRDYSLALGQAEMKRAVELTENALVDSLNDHIKYFRFVLSEDTGSHTLVFRIDKPKSTAVGDQRFDDLSDYYLFLDFNKNNTELSGQIHWLFRDSASSLNGAESAETIAEKILCDISRPQYSACDETKYLAQAKFKDIAKDLLSLASFTNEAEFKPEGNSGWLIQRPREHLCMGQNSKLRIQSLVPPELFENDFDVVVKRRLNGDDESTFTLPDQNVDVEPLLSDPDKAKVLAIFVTSYVSECKSPIRETLPSAVNFGSGGQL